MSKDTTRHKDKDHAERGAEYEPASTDIADAVKLSDEEFERAKHPGRTYDDEANIIGLSQQGAGVEIVVNRGRVDGVAVGDEGVVVGLDERFTITTVREKNCVAFVATTRSEIDAHKTVLLNPR